MIQEVWMQNSRYIVLAHLASCPHWEHTSLSTQHADTKIYGKSPIGFARTLGKSLQSNSYFMLCLTQERRASATTSPPSASGYCKLKKHYRIKRSEENAGFHIPVKKKTT